MDSDTVHQGDITLIVSILFLLEMCKRLECSRMLLEECQIEIKHGSMQFDSHLIIISCNTPPRQMAVSFGWECVEAMYHRFEDPPASG